MDAERKNQGMGHADETAAVAKGGSPRDTESPSHQRAPFSDPLAGGDPTAPGAPHEEGGEAMRQSEIENPKTHRADTPDSELPKSHLGKYPR